MSDTRRKSKFLSLVLRHQPDKAGLTLDEAGWADVDLVLKGIELTREELDHIVSTSDKQRFAYSPDGRHIRANQGHSVEVDLSYERQTPPDLLYHGTATRFLDSIRSQGLQKMARHHVHLSPNTQTALQVGGRHGKPVALVIRAGEMTDFSFYCSANGVWLVDQVPPQFIVFPNEEQPGPK